MNNFINYGINMEIIGNLLDNKWIVEKIPLKIDLTRKLLKLLIAQNISKIKN